MNELSAISILLEVAKVAQKSGSLTLDEASTTNEAVKVLTATLKKASEENERMQQEKAADMSKQDDVTGPSLVKEKSKKKII